MANKRKSDAMVKMRFILVLCIPYLIFCSTYPMGSLGEQERLICGDGQPEFVHSIIERQLVLNPEPRLYEPATVYFPIEHTKVTTIRQPPQTILVNTTVPIEYVKVVEKQIPLTITSTFTVTKTITTCVSKRRCHPTIGPKVPKKTVTVVETKSITLEPLKTTQCGIDQTQENIDNRLMSFFDSIGKSTS